MLRLPSVVYPAPQQSMSHGPLCAQCARQGLNLTAPMNLANLYAGRHLMRGNLLTAFATHILAKYHEESRLVIWAQDPHDAYDRWVLLRRKSAICPWYCTYLFVCTQRIRTYIHTPSLLCSTHNICLRICYGVIICNRTADAPVRDRRFEAIFQSAERIPRVVRDTLREWTVNAQNYLLRDDDNRITHKRDNDAYYYTKEVSFSRLRSLVKDSRDGLYGMFRLRNVQLVTTPHRLAVTQNFISRLIPDENGTFTPQPNPDHEFPLDFYDKDTNIVYVTDETKEILEAVFRHNKIHGSDRMPAFFATSDSSQFHDDKSTPMHYEDDSTLQQAWGKRPRRYPDFDIQDANA